MTPLHPLIPLPMIRDRNATDWIDVRLTSKPALMVCCFIGVLSATLIVLALALSQSTIRLIILGASPPLYAIAWIVLGALGRTVRRTQPLKPAMLALEIAVLTAIPLLAILLDALGGGAGIMLTMYGFVLPGTYLIMMGRPRRTGDTRHCARCDYEFNHPSLLDAPMLCPECNHSWTADLVTGRPCGSRPRLALGVTAVILGFLGPFVGLFFSSSLAVLVPTSVLVQAVGRSPHASFGSWSTLSSRSLTTAQQLELSQLLLDHRHQGRSWSEAGRFLETVYTAGLMPPSMQGRYFDEMFTVALSAPASVRAGEPFEVKLVDGNAWDTSTHCVQIFFAGFSIDQGPLIGRRDAIPWGSLITYSEEYRPVAALIAPPPGQRTVRAVMWVTVGPTIRAQASWNPDGTPVLPPTVLWSKRLELTQPITIKP